MHPLYLVDAPIYFFRSWFAFPDRFFSPEGHSTNGLYGYAHFLLDLLIQKKPVYIAAAFDESLNTCFRNRIFPEYKANREQPDENLTYQLNQCRRLTSLLGVVNIAHKEYEADDIIGSLKKQLGRRRSVIIVTRDKDLGQLLGKKDKIWDPVQDEYQHKEDIVRKFGVPPESVADLLALAGDAVDNIPGVPGIGVKTASAILNFAGSVNNLMRNPGIILNSEIKGAARVCETLLDHRQAIIKYKQLTTVFCDMNLGLDISSIKVRPASRRKLLFYCDEVNFGTAIRAKMKTLGVV